MAESHAAPPFVEISWRIGVSSSMDIKNLNEWTASRYVVLHALAYLAHGRDFNYLDLRQGKVDVPHRAIERQLSARVGMVGEVAEMQARVSLENLEFKVIKRWISVMVDTSNFLLEDDEAPDCDLLRSAYYFAESLHWAWAFEEANASLVDELARSALLRQLIFYEEFIELLAYRQPALPTEVAIADAQHRFDPWADLISEIEINLIEARRGEATRQRAGWS
jgi:hypothetical protein